MEKAVLKRLSEVTEHHVQAIAVELAEAIREIELADARLSALQRYVDEYEMLMERGMERGMSAAGSRNYQQFMLNLSHSVSLQRKALNVHNEQLAILQGRWREARRCKQKYKALLVRSEMRARRSELRRMQRELDELGRPCFGVAWVGPGRSA